MLNVLSKNCLVIIVLFFTSCGSTFDLTKSEKNSTYQKAPTNEFLVMVLYPDSRLETRLAFESDLVTHFKNAGFEATAGYKHFDEYDNLQKKVVQILEKMSELGFESVLIIDPIRAKEHDPTVYANKVAVYRALGMESSTFWASVGEMSATSDASKFIMGVTFWDILSEDYGWHGIYDIKAPGAYDLQAGKEYTKQFAEIIVEKLRVEKLLN